MLLLLPSQSAVEDKCRACNMVDIRCFQPIGTGMSRVSPGPTDRSDRRPKHVGVLAGKILGGMNA